ncbi:hypothetical protein METBIDRAFT_142269 [Metschnikowia bicuspidata var. bicuspidata NRRL YB-4993]|uniref:Probable vacuolar protein sorting-associated protein 16 homolog n=1 Tax=Metschnikowia bicuspidata var. bicuspidata NRRL YB-4993 TaxID=869754 RepID=A0A1A0HD86_9ASCO|nr:hypothetical protein METBIDRAFT_142269 [Metschnikowia bicuspidata var. bicuspidata NRRL YB-4993]OBA21935.1 hypothetical protein METBIDRAFT_142269 [Metschnikowia bicuspidata var. bicuspidata NRRL YB-4993]
MANPSLSWQKLQDVYYSLRPCFDPPTWDLEDLPLNYRVRVLASASLVAVALRFVAHPSVVAIYSASGSKLWTLVHNPAGAQDHIVDFVFAAERLCVVLASGTVRVYSDLWGTFDEYSLVDGVQRMAGTPGTGGFKYVVPRLEDAPAAAPRPVVAADVWGAYLMVRYEDRMTFMHTASFRAFEVPYPSLLLQQVHAVGVVLAAPQALTCVMSYAHTVYTIRVDFARATYEFADEQLTAGPFRAVAALANGRLVALLNAHTQRVYVASAAFDAMLLEYDTSNESSVPYLMQWAASDALILSLRDEVKLVAPGQRLVSFFYDAEDQPPPAAAGPAPFTVPLLVPRPDGVTIITSRKVEFLARVPAASVRVFLVGSAHPARVLLDCVDKLAHHASKADSGVALLRAEGLLVDAVDGCLAAALEEFSPRRQKALLKAASFGKLYVDGGYDADSYVRVVNTLKVLNQLRTPEVALFLSHAQLVALGWPAVVDMLLARSLHWLALRVVGLLGLHACTPPIYVHWCCCKIRTERAMPDLELFRVVAKKLLAARGSATNGVAPRNLIPIAAIFDVALQEGRPDLCKLLACLEPAPTRKVAMLLEIDELDLALRKCFQTCNYDLCVLILRHLKDTLSAAAFQRVLSQTEVPDALREGPVRELLKDDRIKHFFQDKLHVSGNLIGNLWKESTAKHDPALLKEFYTNAGRSTELNVLRLEEYGACMPEPERPSEYSEVYQSQKRELSRLADNRKLRPVVQAELSTLELRYRLSNTFQQSFFGEPSVVAIISRLIKMYQLKPAAKVVKDFKIPQTKFWNLVLDLYCHSGEFDRLNRFIVEANSNAAVYKSPIGFETIVETCLVFDCPRHYVSTYIKYCSEINYSERVKLYMRNGDMILAAEEAFNNKDAELLLVIQKGLQAEDANVLDAIKSYLNRLGV